MAGPKGKINVRLELIFPGNEGKVSFKVGTVTTHIRHTFKQLGIHTQKCGEELKKVEKCFHCEVLLNLVPKGAHKKKSPDDEYEMICEACRKSPTKEKKHGLHCSKCKVFAVGDPLVAFKRADDTIAVIPQDVVEALESARLQASMLVLGVLPRFYNIPPEYSGAITQIVPADDAILYTALVRFMAGSGTAYLVDYSTKTDKTLSMKNEHRGILFVEPMGRTLILQEVLPATEVNLVEVDFVDNTQNLEAGFYQLSQLIPTVSVDSPPSDSNARRAIRAVIADTSLPVSTIGEMFPALGTSSFDEIATRMNEEVSQRLAEKKAAEKAAKKSKKKAKKKKS